MDFTVQQLLDSLINTRESIKNSMRETTAAYRNIAKPAPVPTSLIKKEDNPYTLRQFIADQEKEIGAPSGLLYSVLATESGQHRGGSFKKSHKGAEGIAQQMPAFVADMKKKLLPDYDPNNPVHAVLGAATYLKQNFDTFGSWEKALIAYNAGRQSMFDIEKGIKDLPKESLDYVKIVDYSLKHGTMPRERATTKEFESVLDTPTTNFFKRN